jgi:hypothetical protein
MGTFQAKIIVLLIPALFACTRGGAQTDNVQFKITDINRLSNSRLRIIFRFSTSGDAPVVLPKLGKDHLCSSLLRIDISDPFKTYRILPCSSAIHLDELILDSTNGVILRHGRTCMTQIILTQKELPLKLRSGSYRFQAEFNLQEFNITSRMGTVYKANLKSNQFILKAE